MEALVSFGASVPQSWEEDGEGLGYTRVCVCVHVAADTGVLPGCVVWGCSGAGPAAQGDSRGHGGWGRSRCPPSTRTSASPVGRDADVSFGLHSHSCQEWVGAMGAPPPAGLFVTVGAMLFPPQ